MNTNYVGVDWLTATSADDQVGASWLRIFHQYHKFYNDPWPVNDRWHNGFYGGLSTSGLKWGYSDKLGYIMIATSDTANVLFQRVSPKATKVTRLDLCVDIVLPRPKELANICYEQFGEIAHRGGLQAAIWENTGGGKTLYVGKRSSDQMGRLYDKGIESGVAAKGLYWRWEVEFHKAWAAPISEQLNGLSGEEMSSKIKNLLGTWYTDRGIREAKGIATAPDRVIIAMVRRTTLDKKIAWLRTQVRPTVRTLLEAGLGRQVAMALLLDTGELERMIDELQAEQDFIDGDGAVV
jgi:hypothetical protein